MTANIGSKFGLKCKAHWLTCFLTKKQSLKLNIFEKIKTSFQTYFSYQVVIRNG